MSMRMAVTSRATLVAVVEARQLSRVIYAALAGCERGDGALRYEVHSDGTMVMVVPRSPALEERTPI